MTIIGYKGFDKNLQCMSFQYEIGKTYRKQDNEEISLCQNGFHFCENPLDVFSYYPPLEGNRYCRVIGGGKIDTSLLDTKVAVQEIEILEELTCEELIQETIKYLGGNEIPPSEINLHSASADYNKDSRTNGESCNSATSGNKALSMTVGHNSHSVTAGSYAQSLTKGNDSNSATCGNEASSITFGNNSKSMTAGYNSSAITFGVYSHAVSVGTFSNAITHGNSSHAVTCAEGSSTAVEGNNSIAVGIGIENRAKGELDDWLVLAEYSSSGRLLEVKAVQVDGIEILPSTWYTLKEGKFEIANKENNI